MRANIDNYSGSTVRCFLVKKASTPVLGRYYGTMTSAALLNLVGVKSSSPLLMVLLVLPKLSPADSYAKTGVLPQNDMSP